MNLKFLSVLLLAIAFVAADSSSEESSLDVGIFKSLIKSSYESNKLHVISDLVENALGGDSDNITIVGTQNVLNKDGSLKEVRTIALHVPTNKKQNLLEDIGDDDEDSDVGDFGEISGIFEMLQNVGLPGEAMYKESDKTGKLTEAGYINIDNTFILSQGIAYLNKTIRVTDEKVIEEKIKSLKGNVLPLCILKYDSEGNFLESDSTVAAELFVSVVEEENAEPAILKTIIDTVGKIRVKNLHSKNNISKEIVLALNEKLPKYSFQVASDADGRYVSKDIFVKVNAGFSEIFDVTIYNIYGVLIENV